MVFLPIVFSIFWSSCMSTTLLNMTIKDERGVAYNMDDYKIIESSVAALTN